MPTQPVRTCSRCGHRHIGVPVAPAAGALHYCAQCGTYTLVKELGEMADRRDRADVDSWGHLGEGWT